jgi:hypothetical protein
VDDQEDASKPRVLAVSKHLQAHSEVVSKIERLKYRDRGEGRRIRFGRETAGMRRVGAEVLQALPAAGRFRRASADC